MRIYTRTGDDGTTGLVGSTRVSKADLRIDCCGSVDELNAALGAAAVLAPEPILSRLRAVQNELFVVGSHFATPDPHIADIALPPLKETLIRRLEMEIDAAEAPLAPLGHFILPGGSELAARLHLARTICRRAERLVVHLAQAHPVLPQLVTYLNRLSDWLFVHARLANHLAAVPDVPWTRS